MIIKASKIYSGKVFSGQICSGLWALSLLGLSACQSAAPFAIPSKDTNVESYAPYFGEFNPPQERYRQYAQSAQNTDLMKCLREYQFTGQNSLCAAQAQYPYHAQHPYYARQAVQPNVNSPARPMRYQHNPEPGAQLRMQARQTSSPFSQSSQTADLRPDFLSSNLQGQRLQPLATSRPVSIDGQTGSGDLIGLVNAIKQNNPTLEVERLRLQEIDENQGQAKALSRPSIGIEASAGLRQSDTDFAFEGRPSQMDTRPLGAVQAFITQPLYQGGRAKAMRNKTRFDSEVALETFNGIEDGVLYQAATVYLDILRDRKRSEIYAQSIRGLAQQEDISLKLLQANEATLSDVALIQSRLASAKIDMSRAESEAQTNISQYKNLAGRAPGTGTQMPNLYEPRSIQEVKDTAFKNNPEIKAANHKIDAAEQEIKLAKADGKPSASLRGLLRGSNGQSQTIRRDSAAELLFNVSIPIYSGGSTKSKVRQSKLAHSRVILESRTTQQEIFKNIDQRWAELQSAKQIYDLGHLQLKTAYTAYDSVKREKDAGVATVTDVLLAEEQYRKSELNVVLSAHQIEKAKLELLFLMGRL